MVKIIKEGETIKVQHPVILLYGEPGVGKTSLAFSAKKPILFDFDRGVHRSAFRKDFVPIEKWRDIMSVTSQDVRGYTTIGLDTVGRALDMGASHLQSTNPKFIVKATGMLSQSGWGALSVMFRQWAEKVRADKDIIFVAHAVEAKKGDDIIIRPEIPGKTQRLIIELADAIGYCFMEGDKRILDFTPRDDRIGKDPAGIGRVVIPDLHDKPDFMSEIIKTIKDKLSSESKEDAEIKEKFAAWEASIEEADSGDALNALMRKVRPDVNATLKRLIWEKCREKGAGLGLMYNKETKLFIAAKPDDTVSPQALKKLFAVAKECGWTDKQVKEFIKLKYGKDSRKALTQQEISETIKHIEAHWRG